MGISKKKITIKAPLLVLSGDIGGTKTRLQLTHFTKENIDILAMDTYYNAEFNSFTEIASVFLKKHASDKPQCACFAFAGPIRADKVHLTNLPWTLSVTTIASQLSIPKVYFINDFEAISYGMLSLTAEDYCTIQVGKPGKIQNNVKAIIGAGTGLGIAFVHSMHDVYHVFSTEGGHVDFAPTDDTQEALLSYLRKKLHRVSNERIVSGIGITNIYKFVRTLPTNEAIEHPKLQQLAANSSNFSKQISAYALQHRDPLALQTLDIFIRCYGSVAGNLALTTLPYDGLYLAGGIAPKLLPLLQDGRFMTTFMDKGRSSRLLADIPVHVLLNTHIGLKGAAYYAINCTN